MKEGESIETKIKSFGRTCKIFFRLNKKQEVRVDLSVCILNVELDKEKSYF